MGENILSERSATLCRVAADVEKLLRDYGRRQDIRITFSKLDPETREEFTAWDCEYFTLLPGLEYFFIWEPSRPDVADPWVLLYVVNVTADSPLYAARELLDLIAVKF